MNKRVEILHVDLKAFNDLVFKIAAATSLVCRTLAVRMLKQQINPFWVAVGYRVCPCVMHVTHSQLST